MAAEIKLHSVRANHSISDTSITAVFNAWSACDGGNPEVDLMPLNLITNPQTPQLGSGYDLDDDLAAPGLIVTAINPADEIQDVLTAEDDGKKYRVRPIVVTYSTNSGGGGGRPAGETSVDPEEWTATFSERSERIQVELPTGQFWGLHSVPAATGAQFLEDKLDVTNLQSINSTWGTNEGYIANADTQAPVMNSLGQKFSETTSYTGERAVRIDSYSYNKLTWNDSSQNIGDFLYRLNDKDLILSIPARSISRYYPRHTAKLQSTQKTSQRFIYTDNAGSRQIIDYFNVTFEVAYDPLGWYAMIPNVATQRVLNNKLVPFLHRGKLKPEFLNASGGWAGRDTHTYLVYSNVEKDWYNTAYGFVDGNHITAQVLP